jgi:hypothetical protein
MNPVVKAIHNPKRCGSWGGSAGATGRAALSPTLASAPRFRSELRTDAIGSPCYGGLLPEERMAKKIKGAAQSPRQAPNPYAPAYAARLARQVTVELSSGRPTRKKKQGAGKTPRPSANSR